MRRTARSLVPAVSVAVVLSLANAGFPASAADATDEGAGLCRVIDIDQVAGLTGQQYDETPFWDLDGDCKYLATSNPNGSHYVRLHLDGSVPWEALREGSAGVEDLEVGGHRAFSFSDDDPRGWLNTQVVVDLMDATLRTTLIADQGADANQMDNTVRVAETAVGNLDTEPAPLGTPDATTDDVAIAEDIPRLELPTIEGLEWEGDIEGYGAAIADLEAAGVNVPFDALLEPLGADISRLGFRTANASDVETGESQGGYLAVRVVGTDAASLEPAVMAWLAGLLGSETVPVERVSVGGRDVLLVTEPPGQQTYVYLEGDAAHLMIAPEAVAVAIIETLP